MFGARKGYDYNKVLKDKFIEIFKNMLNESRELYSKLQHSMRKGIDQRLLAKHIWPYAKDDSVIHDSYTCKRSDLRGTGIRPFPTRRLHGTHNFVGDRWSNAGEITIKKHGECPRECRPKEHTDWKIC